MIEVDIGTCKVDYDLSKGNTILDVKLHVYDAYGIFHDSIKKILKNGKKAMLRTKIEESDNIAILWEKQYHEHPLHMCAYTNNVKGIRFWITQGVNPDIRNNYGQTPLMQGCYYGNIDAITELLHLGADVTLKTRFNETVLHFLCYFGEWNENTEEILRLLLANGINIDEQNADGKTARDLLNYKDKNYNNYYCDYCDYINFYQKQF